MAKTIFLGLDVETGGPVPDKNPLLAVGFCVYIGDKQHNLEFLDACEVHLDADVDTYDPDTLEFWKKNPDAWDCIKKDCVAPDVGATQLIDFLKIWQKYSLDNKLTFKIVTDNCWFDNLFVSLLLSRYGGQPLRYNYFTGYMKLENMIDLDQRVMSLVRDLGKPFSYKDFTPSVPHDHTPVNDARGIVEKYAFFLKTCRSCIAPK